MNGNLKKGSNSNEAGVTLKLLNLDNKKGEGMARSKSRELPDNRAASKVTEVASNKPRAPLSLMNPRRGDYALNRTDSTEGLAAKLSLELKKKFLLGNSLYGCSVQKSCSTSNVDTKLRSFTDSISQHQKLLNPAPEPSATMQAFLQGTSKLSTSYGSNAPLSPLSPLQASSYAKTKDQESELPGKAEVKPNKSSYQQSHLPDLLKDSTSILKSKTDSSIPRKFSGNLTEEQQPPAEEIVQSSDVVEEDNHQVAESEVCRSRSPLHETSIIVPNVDWNRKDGSKDDESSDDSEIDSDSLSTGDEKNDYDELQETSSNLPPPRLQIHSTEGHLLLDEGTYSVKPLLENFEPDSIECNINNLNDAASSPVESSSPVKDTKRVTIMEFETVSNDLKQLDLHDEKSSEHSSSASKASNNKQDDSDNDVTTAAVTETEFSEWAHEGEVLASDDLQDVEFNINPEFITVRRGSRLYKTAVNMAKEEDLTDVELDSIKMDDEKAAVCENDTSNLLMNGQNIDFMDTDNESLLDDSLREAFNTAVPVNRGYIEFVNVKASPLKSSGRFYANVVPPVSVIEPRIEQQQQHYSYNNDNVIEISPITMDDIRARLNNGKMTASVNSEMSGSKEEDDSDKKGIMYQSMEEDSLVVLEQAEDTTTSEQVTIVASPMDPEIPPISSSQETSTQQELEEFNDKSDANNADYLQCVKRLQSRIAEFSNAKDSLDVRKSKKHRNVKNLTIVKPVEMINEEAKSPPPPPPDSGSYVSNSSTTTTTTTTTKLEDINKERKKCKNIIEDLLMEKLEAQKSKSAEKKAKRAARVSSFKQQTSSSTPISPLRSTVLSPTLVEFVPNSIVSPTEKAFAESLDIPKKPTTANNNDNSNFRTPVAPPRSRHEEAKRTTEKAKQEARERARLKSDEDLGLSPEDRIKELRQKVTTRRQLVLDTGDHATTTKKGNFDVSKPFLRLQTSKSTDNMKALSKRFSADISPSAKSMDELLDAAVGSEKGGADEHKRDKKKPKDPERRKSIIQAVSDFFKKKDTSLSPNSKDKLSMFRLTPRSKDKSKVMRFFSKFRC